MFSWAQLFKKTQPGQPMVLGIDGGGTKTHVLLADLQGTIVAEDTGGPTNFAAISKQQALANLKATLTNVFRQAPTARIEGAVIGMAGVDTQADETAVRAAANEVLQSFGVRQYQLINDSAVALAGGSEAPNALILIAGTGSICYGRSANGMTAKAGGMDYLLADEGSGYWIGRKVLRSVVRATDGRGPDTKLTALVLRHFQIQAVGQLKKVVYDPPLSKMAIAELAKVWEEALVQDDRVAEEIRRMVVTELGLLVAAVARSLSFQNSEFDLVLAGSIARLSVVEPLLRARLTQLFPKINIVIPSQSPVHGAIKLALQDISAKTR